MQSAAVAQSSPSGGRRWIFGRCEYIDVRRQLIVNGQPVSVEAKPLDVLQRLLEKPGEIVPRRTLLDEVWEDAIVSDQSLSTAIRKLRFAFGGARESIVLNVSGIGYRMAVPVTCLAAAERIPEPVCLQPGDRVPGAEDWIVDEPLDFTAVPCVWLSHHKGTKQVRVFKLANDGIGLRALQREVALSRIFAQKLKRQPGFARIHTSNFDRAPYSIECEYAGPNLYHFSRSERFRTLTTPERLALTVQLLEIIAATHRLGILHNDLKPANILIAQQMPSNGPEWQVTVVDFGVASLTETGRLLAMQVTHYEAFDKEAAAAERNLVPQGSPLYWAPELRVPGAMPDALTDVYALGILIYQILTGDFADTLSPGWEARIADPLLRVDIAEAAHVNPRLRTQTAEALAEKLRTLETRRAAEERLIEQESLQAAAEQRAVRDRQRRRIAGIAGSALLVSLCVTLWSYHRVAQALDLANQRNLTLEELNGFLSEDLLNQSNPMLGKTTATQVQQETLVDAIENALPQIDRRFTSAPAIAGQLHETIAGALDGQTRFAEAEQEFSVAAERFRQAQGPISEKAIIAELRAVNTAFRSRESLRIQPALVKLDRQERLIAQLTHVSPTLKAWNALALTGSQLVADRTVNGVSILEDAIKSGQASPGFSQTLLRALRLRLCPVYLSRSKLTEAERIAREVVDDIRASGGPQSRELFQAETFLVEALHDESKYRAAVVQAKANVTQLMKSLGSDNQLTLANLYMQADDEGALEDYPDAIRDDLAVYNIARKAPSGSFSAENALTSAAAFECHSASFDTGLQYALQAMAESGPSRFNLPAFVHIARFQAADCLISKEETVHQPSVRALDQADSLLATTNSLLVAHTFGLENFEGSMDVARARLNLLYGRRQAAATYIAKATPLIQRPNSDAYQRREWEKLKKRL